MAENTCVECGSPDIRWPYATCKPCYKRSLAREREQEAEDLNRQAAERIRRWGLDRPR